MKSTAYDFNQQAELALQNNDLQEALANAKSGFIDKRAKAVVAFENFEALKQAARSIRDFTRQHLDFYLQQFEQQVSQNGGFVHWASTPEQANEIIVDLCQKQNAKKVTKGKSMIAEETGLNQALEAAGLDVIETDLGEYIIQLAQEPPSHIIAPAVHKTRAQVSALFRQFHHQDDPENTPESIEDIVTEARQILRDHFIAADVGITGANFLVAESGSTIIVTNEGNGDLTNCLPKTHIVISSIDKVIPTMTDANAAIRLLTRSATGQPITNYVTLTSGPAGANDLDGPEQFHVVLLDNGRSKMLGGQYDSALACIRCGACLNHCPVYGSVGGHAYGWVYPGPIGSVLTPLMQGVENAGILANACTMCGRCAEVCPMKIPLPQLLRNIRNEQFEQGHAGKWAGFMLKLWAGLALRPNLYHAVTRVLMFGRRILMSRKKLLSWTPFTSAWTKHRDLPLPQGKTFMQQWAQKK